MKQSANKIGRNDFCNCGSGKKYKKCCMRGEENTTEKPTKHAVTEVDLFQQAIKSFENENYNECISLVNILLGSNLQNPDALHLSGAALMRMERLDEALEYVNKAIALNPDAPNYHNTLGVIYRTAGNYEKAVEASKRAISLPEGRTAANLCNLGSIYKEIEDYENELKYYNEACAIDPNHLPLQINMAHLNYDVGNFAKSQEMFGQLLQKIFSPGLLVTAKLAFPHIYFSNAEIIESRKRVLKNIEELEKQKIRIKEPEKEICSVSFYNAYHGMNDRELLKAIADFYAKTCPELLATAEHCVSYKKMPGKKVSIGIISSNFCEHSVSKAYNKYIEKLCGHPEFEINIISAKKRSDATSAQLANKCNNYIILPANLEKARGVISALKQDIIIYLDIGMDIFTYFLAFARLAPVQCVMGGHPTTTGISNIDYFLSPGEFEPEGAESHYTEKLVRLKNNPVYYNEPVVPEQLFSRKELEFPEGKKLYICPMLLQKVHPNFDKAIKGILEKDKNGIVVFFKSKSREWHNILMQRFEKNIPEVAERILFIPQAEHNKFVNILMNADVLLDTFHFGGGTTNFTAFAAGVPIVTLPGEYLRGRATYGLYKLMGIEDAIAKDINDYVNKAVNIANDEKAKSALVKKILKNKHKLFRNDDTISEAIGFFSQIYGENHTKSAQVQVRPQAVVNLKTKQMVAQAIAKFKNNNLDEAREIADEVVRAEENSHEALHLLAAIDLQKGEVVSASENAKKALSLSPDNPHYHNTYANALRVLGKSKEAEKEYLAAINFGLNKKAEVYRNLAIVQGENGNFTEAAANFDKAIELSPNSAAILMSKAEYFSRRGSLQQAVKLGEKAMALEPDNYDITSRLGELYVAANQYDKAEEILKKILVEQPDDYRTILNLAYLQDAICLHKEALENYRKVLALKPSASIKCTEAFFIPVFSCSNEEIDVVRAQFLKNIARLEKEKLELKEPELEIRKPPFFYSYHGRNDKELVEKLAGFFEKACPALLYEAPHCQSASNNQRVKIGFISAHFGRHVVDLAFYNLIKQLSGYNIDISIIIASSKNMEGLGKNIYEEVGKVIFLPDNLQVSREVIAAEELDILFYLDLGMDVYTYFLAFARLAQVQCTIGGHPITSGIKNIDYFISNAVMEPENAQEYYSEKLIKLQNNPVSYKKIKIPEKFASRKELGLPEDKHIYMCPMLMHKFHPDFHGAIRSILQQDKDGVIILFKDQKHVLHEEISRHFAQIMPDVAARIIFLPFAEKEQFLYMLKNADVLLDTFHYGGGTTNYIAFALGTPIVTLPGAMLRGRATYGMYKTMGIADAIAKNPEDYVKLAIKIASDKKLYKKLEEQILANNHLLFERDEVVVEMVNFFAEVTGREDVAGYKPKSIDIKDFDAFIAKAEEFVSLGRKHEAVAICGQAAELAGSSPEKHDRVAVQLAQARAYDLAERHFKIALSIKPGYYSSSLNLSQLYYHIGKYEEAVEGFKALAGEHNTNLVRIINAMMLPPINESNEQIDNVRKAIIKNLWELKESGLKLEKPEKESPGATFYHTYHGRNDKEFMQKLAEFFTHVAPSLNYVAPHVNSNNSLKNSKVKVGFISMSFYNHSVGQAYNNLLSEISSYKELEVFIITPRKIEDYYSIKLRDAGMKIINITTGLDEARKTISEFELDVLVYTDIGMDAFIYFLAFSRLAPVQCVLPGHPSTTGIPTIDYFLSPGEMEKEGAESHYSEKLIRLVNNPVAYDKPEIPEAATRAELGLPEGKKLYICPMYLQKLHPDFDAVVQGILEKDKNGVVIFFENEGKYWHEDVKKRFARTIPSVLDRVIFLPPANKIKFMQILPNADILLDTFHFGGGTTCFLAFASGAPMVTLPSNFICARATYGLYKKMGINDLIATDVDDYIKIAVNVANDDNLSSQLRKRLLSQNYLLFENNNSVAEMAELLVGFAGRKFTGQKIDIIAQKEHIKKFMEQAIKAFQDKKYENAAAIANNILSFSPDNHEALHMLGAILHKTEYQQEAEKQVRKAIRLMTRNPNYYNTLGGILKAQGKYDEAIKTYLEAIKIQPQAPEFYINISSAFGDSGYPVEALKYAKKALELNQQLPSTYKKLGGLFIQAHHSDMAIKMLEMAVNLYGESKNDDCLEAKLNLCQLYYVLYDSEYVLPQLEKLIEDFPNYAGVKVTAALMLPQMLESKEQIQQLRQRFVDNIDGLIKSGIKIKNPEKEIASTPFYQIYHGENDKDLLVKMAEFYEKSCQYLSYTAEHCKEYLPKKPGDKIKVGFASVNFYNHSVAKAFAKYIKELSKLDEFEIYVLSGTGMRDYYTDYIEQSCHHFIQLPKSLGQARELIANLALDSIIYLDIGMDTYTYFLAFARLAPVQVTIGGHPVTSGIRNMDYFIAPGKMEVEHAEGHYSEKLVRFNNNPAYYEKPVLPDKSYSREELDLPEDRNLYICPMQLQKIHPDFDVAVKEILEKDKNGVVVFFKSEGRMWHEKYSKRLEKTMPGLMDRVMFLPFADKDRFVSVLKEADALLDTFHFGGGTTNFIAFAAGAPIVTLPGEFLRGRATLGLYNEMGITGLIAKNKDEYVNLAVKLANDKAFHNRISKEILERSHILYENYGAIEEMANFLKEVVKVGEMV